ncbi:MAG TPA: hypothetical protein VNW53_10890 [Phenylobacterium sp.]|jgi:hypothetical protein|uniref:hypothetical protein n=1 Tax=Phenylobacterium sp. TaxID=1871053 RepID=UPI002BBD1714|nr:hypothetical protein [Phenylobacterium sp.]HXA39497.1 hypothetical protein [Phenylobacterium sp.]
MPGYRLYFIADDGHIAQAAEFECEADEEAVLHAEDQREHRTLELWSGVRMVAKFPRRLDA